MLDLKFYYLKRADRVPYPTNSKKSTFLRVLLFLPKHNYLKKRLGCVVLSYRITKCRTRRGLFKTCSAKSIRPVVNLGSTFFTRNVIVF
jgi:hypothetical protein